MLRALRITDSTIPIILSKYNVPVEGLTKRIGPRRLYGFYIIGKAHQDDWWCIHDYEFADSYMFTDIEQPDEFSEVVRK